MMRNKLKEFRYIIGLTMGALGEIFLGWIAFIGIAIYLGIALILPSKFSL